MSFKKGRKKTGGREKGTLNKVSMELGCLLNSVVESELLKLPEQLEKIEPEKRVLLLSKLLPYVLPKKERVEIDSVSNISESITLTKDEAKMILEEIENEI